MPKTAVLTADAKAAKRKAFRKHLKRYWVLYAMLVLPVAYYIVFKYVPMVGNVLAFRRYRPGKGPFGTEWTLRYFDRFLRDPMFWRALRNTLVLSIGNILINFPIPILFAILLNEVRAKKFKKFVQTVSYMPRFISTVVVIAILNEILSPSSGILNQFLGLVGVDPIYFMNEPQWFRPVYILSETWQFTGWTAIIYLAAITSISPDLFEAAEMDGASATQRFAFLTLPLLRPTMVFIVITSLISYFQTYIPVMVLTQGGPGTKTYLASYIIYDQAFVKYNFGYASAISFILFALIAALTALSFRASGGVKA